MKAHSSAVAVGQGAIGVVAVGMGSVGLVWSLGMIGVGGRGFGFVLPLVPSLGPRVAAPDFDAMVQSAMAEEGHLRPSEVDLDYAELDGRWQAAG